MKKTIYGIFSIFILMMSCLAWPTNALSATKQQQDAWFATAEGRYMNPDGVEGYQCVDVPKDYCLALWGDWRNTVGSGNAVDVFNNANPAFFTKIANDPNDPNQIPQYGDIAVWYRNGVPGWDQYGHVAVVKSATTQNMTVLQQSGDQQTACYEDTASYVWITGWLRPKLTVPPTAPSVKASVSGRNVTLSWSGATGTITHYWLLITNSAGREVFSQSMGLGTSYTGSFDDDIYQVNVTPVNGAVLGKTGSVSFEIDTAAPTAPTVIVSVNSQQVNLSWSGATGTITHYWLLITNSAGKEVFSQNMGLGTRYTDSFDEDTYRVSVTPCNGDILGKTGSVSFEIDVQTDTTDFVTKFYELCLGRQPDSTGLAYWVDKLSSGEKTGADVAQGFVFSNEFTGLGVSNEEYLDVLYNAFFNREPDSGGYDYWLGQLNRGKSRLVVLAGFVNANEFQALCEDYGISPGSIDTSDEQIVAFVTRFFEECLGRQPDQAGLNYWVDSLDSGASTGADVAYGFVFSNEFQANVMTDEEYLEVLFTAFFNREPDSGGLTYWLEQLDGGTNRLEVLAGFVNSNEFASLCSDYGIEAGGIDA